MTIPFHTVSPLYLKVCIQLFRCINLCLVVRYKFIHVNSLDTYFLAHIDCMMSALHFMWNNLSNLFLEVIHYFDVLQIFTHHMMDMFCQHNLPFHLSCFALGGYCGNWRVDDTLKYQYIFKLFNHLFERKFISKCSMILSNLYLSLHYIDDYLIETILVKVYLFIIMENACQIQNKKRPHLRICMLFKIPSIVILNYIIHSDLCLNCSLVSLPKLYHAISLNLSCTTNIS